MIELRILYIEDSPSQRLAMRRAINGGAQLSEAATLESGLKLARAGSCDVIVSDLNFGNPQPSSSHETIEVIHQFVPHAPVIVLTGMPIEELIEPVIMAGADGIYDKALFMHSPDFLLRECRYAQLRRQRDQKAAELPR